MKFAGDLLENHPANDASASENAAPSCGFADAIEFGREEGTAYFLRQVVNCQVGQSESNTLTAEDG